MLQPYGCGLHPLAELRQQQLEGPNLTPREDQDASRLAAPFKSVDSEISPFRPKVARRLSVMNSAPARGERAAARCRS